MAAAERQHIEQGTGTQIAAENYLDEITFDTADGLKCRADTDINFLTGRVCPFRIAVVG